VGSRRRPEDILQGSSKELSLGTWTGATGYGPLAGNRDNGMVLWFHRIRNYLLRFNDFQSVGKNCALLNNYRL
jgi:hypothetical protein